MRGLHGNPCIHDVQRRLAESNRCWGAGRRVRVNAPLRLSLVVSLFAFAAGIAAALELDRHGANA